MNDTARSHPTGGSVEDDRRLLMSVAYRLLSSVTDAADAVQDAYARWYGFPPERRAEVVSPTGWLITTVSRICLDRLGSARARREQYVGQWLPEPVPDRLGWTSQAAGDAVDPADRTTLDESVTMALLVVLETMTPAERVAFVLHDVFGYPYGDIAGIVGRSPEACRQLASSARRRVGAQRRRTASLDEQARVVTAFKAAWETGDVTALIALLDADVIATTDGGGQVSAALEPVGGAASVAQLLIDVSARRPDLRLERAMVNELPGLVARSAAGEVLAVISVAIFDGAVDHLWIVRNPEKLRWWS